MTFIGINIKNEEIFDRLSRMGHRPKTTVMKEVNNSLYEVAKKANDYLIQSIGVDRTPRGLEGHGQPDEHHLADDRDDLSAWEVDIVENNPKRYVAKLTNISEHAAAVEFGVKGYIKPKGNFLCLGYFKGQPIYRKKVKGQKGYGFTQRALDNKTFMKTIRANLRNSIYKSMMEK